MERRNYSKPPLTYQKQLEQLKERGLVIPDEQKCLKLLETISYYRLSGYWYPLLENKERHKFKPNANFETAYKIYQFDCCLV